MFYLNIRKGEKNVNTKCVTFQGRSFKNTTNHVCKLQCTFHTLYIVYYTYRKISFLSLLFIILIFVYVFVVQVTLTKCSLKLLNFLSNSSLSNLLQWLIRCLSYCLVDWKIIDINHEKIHLHVTKVELTWFQMQINCVFKLNLT